MEFTCHYLRCSTWNIQSFSGYRLGVSMDLPAIISVVPRGTFNLFLGTDLEFPWIYPPLSLLFHVEHSIFFWVQTWSFHGIYLQLSSLFHVEHSIFFLDTDLEFPWNSPAIISVVPRGIFNLFLDTDLKFPWIYLPLSLLFHVEHSIFSGYRLGVFMEFTCQYLLCSTWNIQSFSGYRLGFSMDSPVIISVVPRGIFNLFLVQTWSFHGIYRHYLRCTTWNIQSFSWILTWNFHGIHLPLSLLFHVEYSICFWILT